MVNMTSSRDIIIQLKEVQKERDLKQSDIIRMVTENGDYVSKSTVSRLFAEGSEDHPEKFRYEITLRPIANALLDMETIEETDDMDTKAIKTVLKYKIERIEELENEIEKIKASLDKEKVKYHERLDKEREQFRESLDFLKEQVRLKDEQLKMYMESNSQLVELNTRLTAEILECPKRKDCGK